MATRIETVSAVPDAVKWIGAAVVLGGAVGAFYYFSEQSLLLRVIGIVVAVGVAGFIAARTEKGRIAWVAIGESRTEVRKVVWPTRKETTQTTLIVIAMVAIVAILMWMLDAMLAWLVRLLLGQGG